MANDKYLFVVSGAAGTGKDSVVKALREAHPEIEKTVSATTRAPRPGEQEGVDYYYRTREQFQQLIENDQVVEHNFYNGVDHGRDYTGLANYLFDHWTPERGTRHHYKGTRNLCQPEKEAATEAKREYSESKPPRAPKGYRLVEAKTNRYGYMCFKYVRCEDAADAPPPNNRLRPLKC